MFKKKNVEKRVDLTKDMESIEINQQLRDARLAKAEQLKQAALA